MLRRKYFIRYFVLLFAFLVAAFIYTGQLLSMQFANAAKYQRTGGDTYTRTFKVSAVRGEIFDRNGVPLVTNQNIYNLEINGSLFPKSNYTELVINLIELIEANDCTIRTKIDSLPIIQTDNGYSYSMILSTSENTKNGFFKFLERNKLDANISEAELITFLINKYKLDEYTGDNILQVIGVCYDLDRADIAGGSYYTLSEDITAELIAIIKENSHNYPGVGIALTYKRIYNVPGAASHILGTVGPIQAAEFDEYVVNKGYPMDAIIGRSGAERAFEEYLRGEEGIIERTYDQDGNIVDEKYKKEPIRGKNVYLTIDIKLQQIAERSIEVSIDRIHANATRINKDRSGQDANAGAATIINPNNGEILALATYPSYDLTTYSQIEVYNELSIDPLKPFTNRAVMGTYPPGSIFKIVTSVTILEEGALTVDEQIQGQGIYMKYAPGVTPTCWIYPGKHGPLNITKALEHSCNYFYFVASERFAIETLNKYSRHLGLGESTGIEIGETRGILSSKEYTESISKAWVAGDLLNAVIGQGYNVFSPLQTVTMLGTFLNQGTRYSSHLLFKVKEFGADEYEDFYVKQPEILDRVEMSDTTFNAVKQGLRNVIESGTAVRLFRNFPVQVGGKTGTAQHNTNESNHATFVAFAPYDEPEIAMSVVIENGAHGEWAGYVAEDVLGYYFGVTSYNDYMGIPDTPEPEEEDEENGENLDYNTIID